MCDFQSCLICVKLVKVIVKPRCSCVISTGQLDPKRFPFQRVLFIFYYFFFDFLLLYTVVCVRLKVLNLFLAQPPISLCRKLTQKALQSIHLFFAFLELKFFERKVTDTSSGTKSCCWLRFQDFHTDRTRTFCSSDTTIYLKTFKTSYQSDQFFFEFANIELVMRECYHEMHTILWRSLLQRIFDQPLDVAWSSFVEVMNRSSLSRKFKSYSPKRI